MKQNNIGNLLKTECYGCSACRHICPFDAIEMRQDEEGFIYPCVDEDKCTQCGKCRKICPALHEKETENFEMPESYVVRGNNKLRSISTSGGATTLLADHVFEEGGMVCGVVMDPDFHVHHLLTAEKEDLNRIRLSKYVQSDLGNVFPQIRDALKTGKIVMFTGTPCQVAGLKSYVRACMKEIPENLLTVDLVCHGPTSPLVFERYLEETFGKENVEEFKFRTKNYGYNGTTLEVKLKDGQVYMGAAPLDPLQKALYRSLCLRQTCGDCRYAARPRIGDITIGDAWGIGSYKPELMDGKGTSLMLVNSEKGKAWFEKIKGDAQLLEAVPMSALRHNRFGTHMNIHPQRQRFFEMLSYTNVHKAVSYCMDNRYDVGVVGMSYGCNYGSLATYYALQKVLEGMGLSVLMIDKPGAPADDRELKPENHNRIFAKKHFHMSKVYKLSEMKLLNHYCDAFVVGSDQVWNYTINQKRGRSFFLDFVRDEKKMVSIASSFGHAREYSPDRERIIAREYLKRFDAVSVREESGVGILKNVFGVDAAQILDPVFLADRSVFDELAQEAAQTKSGPYLLAYFIDPTPEKRSAVRYLEEKLGLKAVYILDGRPWSYEEKRGKLDASDEVLKDAQVQDWIACIRNSSYVVTDSSNGMSFAILYEKPFAAVGNRAAGFTCFSSPARTFGLEKRLTDNPSEIQKNPEFLKPVDYAAVHTILEREKKRSLDWIHDAMFRPKTVRTYQAYSVEVQPVDSVRKEKEQLDGQVKITFPRKVYNSLPFSVQRRVKDLIKNRLSGGD